MELKRKKVYDITRIIYANARTMDRVFRKS
jgi:hypothetical protein